ncbi:hypothetical protein RMT89_40525 [Streptomyces sp. P17]|nr:hypothetical protein [Streptomyces sp. P17]
MFDSQGNDCVCFHLRGLAAEIIQNIAARLPQCFLHRPTGAAECIPEAGSYIFQNVEAINSLGRDDAETLYNPVDRLFRRQNNRG